MNRFVVALCFTGAGFVVSRALGELVGASAGSAAVVYVAASMAATWYGGVRAGLFAVVLGTAALLAPARGPTHSFSFEQPDDRAALFALVVTSMVGCWVVGIAFEQRRSTFRASAPNYAWLGCFIVANLAAAGLGQGLKLVPGTSITFWPPAGIFVAALLLNHEATWPWWAAGACAAELIGNVLWFHNPLHLALLYFAANCAEALTAAILVRRAVAGNPSAIGPRQLESNWNALRFVVFAAVVAPIVGATLIATADAILGKHSFWSAWKLVWLGDGTGLLLTAPLSLAAVDAWRRRQRMSVQPAVELVGACGLAALAVSLALDGRLPSIYLALPAIVWAAVRFQLPGAWLALTAVILTIAARADAGLGESGGTAEQMHQRLVALQVFLGICASTALLVAGLSARLVRAHRRMQVANRSLEQRILERTAALRESEERFRLFLQGSNVVIAQCDLELRYVWIHDPHPRFCR